MKIIVLGANPVGISLASTLSTESNDVTLVDSNEVRLEGLKQGMDIQVVGGRGSHPDVLEQAGVEDADLLIAVSENDELNMVACRVAYSLYRTPKKICRVHSSSFIRFSEELFGKQGIAVDTPICPEMIVSDNIERLIDLPGALQVLDFADGSVQLVGVKAVYGGPLVGQEIRLLRQHMPAVDTRVAAIFRKDRPIVPEGSTVIEAEDEVFFVAAQSDIRACIGEVRPMDRPYRRIFIAGGGNIGLRLARQLESRYKVKLVERSAARCDYLTGQLESTLVLHGETSDRELLISENIEDADVFVALTNDDEANIMSCMMAKRLGAKKVMALINNPDYVDLIQGGEIDIAISPQQATIGSVLTKVRRADFANVHSLRRGAAEAVEAVVHGDVASSKVIGRELRDLNLPDGITVGAIVRGEGVLIAHDDTRVESGDHVILFLVDRKHVALVERLFGAGFAHF